ncbi:hypothetical protein [Stigmatella aurantiaca]|uniref:Uncharacterized protein n=1 Tax=Stigmatella aurantiaca (strain DW4/3-1) TaxID=378806 RepID=Q08RS8_STIAD|nr:hypothetical protein [Stigmatella aurantiaca]ADO74183.1 uncharacterized protein STAUR_6426 [Stigmatella aurantiaca DW4/3-1]EAU63182.1 conserved hypothetical protein [Stigmatella aurantiaca DW4/3-1]
MKVLAGHAWVALVLGASPAETEHVKTLRQNAERLAQEAKALVNPNGCSKVEECEVAGFGQKACGGPREFVVYCSRTTDTKALQTRLDALMKAEKAWQEAAGLMSNCGLTRRPRPQWVDGVCRAR